MRSTVLEIQGIDAGYGDVQVLHDVSFTVGEGEIVSLLGSNGAGKSTILKVIAGLLKPTRGRVLFRGVDLAAYPVHRVVDLGICLVPEEKQVFSDMTVLENLELGCFVKRARTMRDTSLKFVFDVFPRLEERQRQKAGTLSGGEQKMVLIGRALMSRPTLLLIDELSLGLAPLLVETFFNVMKDLHNNTDLSVVLVEQNVVNALELSDEGVIIENGRVLTRGKAGELLANEQIRDAYLGMTTAQAGPVGGPQ